MYIKTIKCYYYIYFINKIIRNNNFTEYNWLLIECLYAYPNVVVDAGKLKYISCS